MTTVTVTTTYDKHSVPAIVEPAYRMELDSAVGVFCPQHLEALKVAAEQY